MSALTITIVLFTLLLIFLALGLHVAFTLGGLSLVFILLEFGSDGLYMIASTAWESWTNETLITVPLFVVMAQFLTRSGVADDIYGFMHKWMGSLSGGLAMGTVGICTVFAAMTGGSSVGTLTMGLAALPSMAKRGYNKTISLGSISAGGTLGILIPPSIPMIIYAYLANESLGKLFMAGVVPGLLIAFLFIAYIGVRCFLNPDLGPAMRRTEPFGIRQRIISFRSVILPMLLILIVLGFIYLGVTTPTEAAGIGAIGGLICILIYRRFTLEVLRRSLLDTFKITAMVGWIILGAGIFNHVYTGMGASTLVQDIMIGSDMNRWAVLIMTQVILIVMGMFMDPIGIMMLCIPIFVPIIKSLGFDVVWFGVLFVINLEMAFVTPPFGVNLFYMKSVVPENITMEDIYRSIIPFVILELVALIAVMLIPQIALWLPYLNS